MPLRAAIIYRRVKGWRATLCRNDRRDGAVNCLTRLALSTVSVQGQQARRAAIGLQLAKVGGDGRFEFRTRAVAESFKVIKKSPCGVPHLPSASESPGANWEATSSA